MIVAPALVTIAARMSPAVVLSSVQTITKRLPVMRAATSGSRSPAVLLLPVTAAGPRICPPVGVMIRKKASVSVLLPLNWSSQTVTKLPFDSLATSGSR